MYKRQRQDVFEALRKVDNPILKIDAPSDELAALINQPQGEYHVDDICLLYTSILGFCPGGSHRRKAGFDLAVHRCLAEVPE